MKEPQVLINLRGDTVHICCVGWPAMADRIASQYGQADFLDGRLYWEVPVAKFVPFRSPG